MAGFTVSDVDKAMKAFWDCYHKQKKLLVNQQPDHVSEQHVAIHSHNDTMYRVPTVIERALREEASSQGEISPTNSTSGTAILKAHIQALTDADNTQPDYDLNIVLRRALIEVARTLGIELDAASRKSLPFSFEIDDAPPRQTAVSQLLSPPPLHPSVRLPAVAACDLLILDEIVPLPKRGDLEKLGNQRLKEDYAALERFIDRMATQYRINRGGKATLEKEEEYREFLRLIAALPGRTREAGGSAANTLVTFSKLMNSRNGNGNGKNGNGKRAEVDFLGVVEVPGHLSGDIIRNGLEGGKIHLMTPPHSPGVEPQSATSFVFIEPDGEPTLFTWPGNGRAILKPEHITDEMVENSKYIFLQGSCWQKFDPAVADKLMDLRWRQDKEVWLALPTQAVFSKNKQAKDYQYFIPSADVVLGNDRELKNIYETTDLNEALDRLQHDMARVNQLRREHGRLPRPRLPVALITCGKEGAFLVRPEGRKHIPAAREIERVSALGAGDAAYAGFLAGHVAGMSHEDAAELAMEIAAAKLGHMSPRLHNPCEELKNGTDSARRSFGKFEAALAQLDRQLEQTNVVAL